MKFGAHLSIGGGLPKAVDRAVEIGADALQVFASTPRGWGAPNHGEAEIAAFQRRRDETGIAPVFFHAVYLINLATAREDLHAQSVRSLAAYLEWADRLGVEGTVLHLGSGKGRELEAAHDSVVAGLSAALEASPGTSRIFIETSAGMGDSIGGTFGEIGRLIRRLDGHERLGVCLDTCHVFAAGYDVSTPEGLTAALDEFDREIGLDRLGVIHANDSKNPINSGLDRHANIGQGFIGEAGFHHILHEPRLQHLPFILEVPGFEINGKERTGPDAQNVAILRRLRDATEPPVQAAE